VAAGKIKIAHRQRLTQVHCSTSATVTLQHLKDESRADAAKLNALFELLVAFSLTIFALLSAAVDLLICYITDSPGSPKIVVLLATIVSISMAATLWREPGRGRSSTTPGRCRQRLDPKVQFIALQGRCPIKPSNCGGVGMPTIEQLPRCSANRMDSVPYLWCSSCANRFTRANTWSSTALAPRSCSC
jgi:hypothetical protein